MAEVDDSLIKRGFWINHSHGTVLGSTITIDEQSANAIVALIAILISFALSSAWSLLLFLFHQLRATSRPMDGLFRQQQVLLRSLPSPGAAFIDSVKLLWRWRSTARSPVLRCAGPALVALLFSLGSLAAGVFSSYIVKSTNVPVLVKGSSCNNFNYTSFVSHGDLTQLQQWATVSQAAGALFGNTCYNSGPLPKVCNFLVHPRINPSETLEYSPFSPTLSLDNSTGALILDSGYLDSNDIFGINAVRGDRVHLRRRASCVPLDTKDHMDIVSEDSFFLPGTTLANVTPGQNEYLWTYNYGQVTSVPGNVPGNFTIAQTTSFSNMSTSYTTVSSYTYQDPTLAVFNGFVPTDGINRSDADITIAGIFTGTVVSFVPIDGPIYAAHRLNPGNKYHPPCYLSDDPGGVLGCTEQYDFCIQISSGALQCTGFGGARFQGFEESLPSANSIQLATLRLLGAATASTGFAQILEANQDAGYLSSATKVVAGIIPGLPADQWKVDVRRLEGFVWAFMQVFLLWHYTGYEAADPTWLDTPSSASDIQVCHSQKVVKAGGFANINVFALAFTVVVAALLMTWNHVALRGFVFWGKLRKRLSPGIELWFADGVYELQRSAYEGIGAGTWIDTDRDIPLCAAKDRLGILPTHK